jgi:serine/threonine protein kinase
MVAPPWYNTVLIQMLQALEFLHKPEVNIIHRDIKPENILFNDRNHFVLADFGHARRALPPPEGRSDSLHFMAPEMYNGQRQTTAVDLWSLGIVCIDMLEWKPITRGTRTFDSMKEAHWCNAMHELAKELYVFKPEVQKIVENDALRRLSARELLTFLESSSSTQINRMRPPERLTRLKIKSRLGPGVPEEAISIAVIGYLAKHGLSEEGRNATQLPPTRRIAVTTRRLGSISSQNMTPTPRLPGSLAVGFPQRRRGITSIATTTQLTGLGPAESLASPSTRSQGLGGASNAIATPLPNVSQGRGDSESAAATPRRTRSRDLEEPSGADMTQTPQKSNGATTQKPVPTQESERPARAGASLRQKGLQDEEGPSSPFAGSNLQSDSSRKSKQASRRKGRVKPPQATSPTQLEPKITPSTPRTSDGSKSIESPRSTTSSAGRVQKSDQCPISQSSKRLSADAPHWFPPGHSRVESGRLEVSAIRPPVNQSEGRCQQPEVPPALPTRQPMGRGQQERNQPGEPHLLSHSRQEAQKTPALIQLGLAPPRCPLRLGNQYYVASSQVVTPTHQSPLHSRDEKYPFSSQLGRVSRSHASNPSAQSFPFPAQIGQVYSPQPHHYHGAQINPTSAHGLPQPPHPADAQCQRGRAQARLRSARDVEVQGPPVGTEAGQAPGHSEAQCPWTGTQAGQSPLVQRQQEGAQARQSPPRPLESQGPGNGTVTAGPSSGSVEAQAHLNRDESEWERPRHVRRRRARKAGRSE